MKVERKFAAIGTAAGAGSVLATVLLEALFSSGGEARWAEAVMAVLTLVLASATGIYAYLTHRLAKTTEAQLSELRASRRDASLAPLAKLHWSELVPLSGLVHRAYPMTAHAPRARVVSELLAMTQRLVDLQTSLGGLVVGLPASVERDVVGVLTTANTASRHAVKLASSILFAAGQQGLPVGPLLMFMEGSGPDELFEMLEGSAEAFEDLTWTDCKVAYNTAVRREGQADWETLVEDRTATAFKDAVDKLSTTLLDAVTAQRS